MPRITGASPSRPDASEPGSDDSLTKPGAREPLLAALGSALEVAAREGRVDVVAELAAIVGRLAGEGRERSLEVAGVPVLRPGTARKPSGK